jgi:hypothetical protein
MAEAETEYEEAREVAEALGPWQVAKDHDLPHSATIEDIADAMSEGYDDMGAAKEGAMIGFEAFLRGEPIEDDPVEHGG